MELAEYILMGLLGTVTFVLGMIRARTAFVQRATPPIESPDPGEARMDSLEGKPLDEAGDTESNGSEDDGTPLDAFTFFSLICIVAIISWVEMHIGIFILCGVGLPIMYLVNTRIKIEHAQWWIDRNLYLNIAVVSLTFLLWSIWHEGTWLGVY